MLTLRAFTDGDMPLMETWLYTAHVARYYHEPEDWLYELRQRNGEFRFLSHFIAWDEKTPVGFGQYYDCFDAKEDWYSVDNPGQVYSMDYLIGDAAYLNKGYGRDLVRLLVARILDHKDAREIIVQPEKKNRPSNRVLLANGFAFDPQADYYRKKLR